MNMGLKSFFKGLVRFGAAKSEHEHTYQLTDHIVNRLFKGVFGTSSPQWLQFRTMNDYITAWEQCPPLAAILIAKAQADVNGKVSFYYRDSGEPVKVPYVNSAKTLKKLFDKPNPLQTWRQFRAQQKIYQQLFGVCPVLMVKPAGFSDPMATTQMWNLPPQFVNIKTTGKYLFQKDISGIIEKIVFTYGGRDTELPVNDVLLLNDSTISLNNQIVSDSRIRALEMPISNIVAALTSLNVLIVKRGALGVLSNQDKDSSGERVALPATEKEALQNDFKKYGLSPDQWQIIITNANLKWERIVMPVKDLMLHETIQQAAGHLCDSYGYPAELMSSLKPTTFSNKKEAKRSLYQDTTLPEAAADFEMYNTYFGLTETNIELYYDFDHVEALQISEEEKAAATKTNAEAYSIMYKGGAITLNRYRELLNQPTKPGDDLYYYETAEGQQNTENSTQQQEQ